MEVNANGVELLPLAIDGILELLRHIDSIQNVLDNVIHVPVHELVHKLFDLQNSMILEHHEAGWQWGALTLPFQVIDYLLLYYSLDCF